MKGANRNMMENNVIEVSGYGYIESSHGKYEQVFETGDMAMDLDRAVVSLAPYLSNEQDEAATRRGKSTVGRSNFERELYTIT